METLSELAKKVYNARGNPGMLAELHITLATQYATMSEDIMETQLKKADFWQIKDYEDEIVGKESDGGIYIEKEKVMREKPLSDKQVEMMWLKTDDGRMEIKLKYVLRSLEKLMAAIKSSLVNATMEARNI